MATKKKGPTQYLVTEYGRFSLLEITGKYYVTDRGNFRRENPCVLRVEDGTEAEGFPEV